MHKGGQISDEIKVAVIKYPDRDNLVLRYIDPITGKHKTKSAGTTSEKDAQKEAGKWQSELREGRHSVASKLSWADFRKRYEDVVLSDLAPSTEVKARGVFNSLESIVNPSGLRDLTAARISYFQSQLREAGKAESTIKGNMAYLAAALSWAVKNGDASRFAKNQMPKRAKSSPMMKGRPFAGEEFDRLLNAVDKIIKDDVLRADSWKRYLRGLWWSGLRLCSGKHSARPPAPPVTNLVTLSKKRQPGRRSTTP